MLPLAIFLLSNSRLAAAPSPPHGLSALHWNVLWLQQGKTAVVKQTTDWDTDLLLLSEVTEDIGAAGFANRRVLRLRTMLLVVRGELRDIQRHARQALDLVLGDFNTPRSAHSGQMVAKGYQHAYSLIGDGLNFTWPARLPLIALDHCLIGPRLHPTQQCSELCDHRAQQLWFELPAD
ncbi:MAG TPA: hypothetical protein DCR55_18195 [Lentisphaeria bacterium]|nr:hypothetical protein [Lentisphaeria bacterium]